MAYYLSPALARLVIPQTYLAWSSFHGWEAPTRPTPKLKPHPLKVVDSTAVCDGTVSSKAKVCPRQKSPIRNWYTCALVHLLEGTLFRNRNTCTLERTLFVYTVKCAAVIITKEMPHDSNQFWSNHKWRIRIVRYWKRILKFPTIGSFHGLPPPAGQLRFNVSIVCFLQNWKRRTISSKDQALSFVSFPNIFYAFNFPQILN